jgi:hypothetical protein
MKDLVVLAVGLALICSVLALTAARPAPPPHYSNGQCNAIEQECGAG